MNASTSLSARQRYFPNDDWHWSLTEHNFAVFTETYRRTGNPVSRRDKQLATLCGYMIGASMPQTWVIA